MPTAVFRNCGLFIRCCSTIAREMKYLNVAEKNDAAKTIAGLLSNGSARRREGFSVYNKIYEFETSVMGRNAKMVMTSVSGHLFSYEFVAAYRGWSNCDPEQLFDAPVRKACSPDNEKIRKTLEREVKSCQGLIIWTDCDREGENIGFEVLEVCKAVKSNITVHRAKFSDITTRSVKRALANLTQPDQKQNEAVNIRQELDLRTGAAFTRLQTLRLQRLFPNIIADNLISYGSCQIPTLGFVAQRYKEAEDFVSEPFWKLKVIHTINELTVEFNWARNRLFDKEAVEDYYMLCLSDPMATVENVTVKPKNKWRPQPMDTVALEKLGSRKLHLNAKTTMQIAEKLYTQGIISYPRTETNAFSKDVNLRSLVEQQTSDPNWGEFAGKVMEWGPNPRNGQKSDEAHPPIHPTKHVTNLSGNEQRVYELIVRHFLACVSKDATGSETIVNINIAGEKFSANGLVIYERNYLDVYPYEKWSAKEIHRYENGQRFEPTEISMHEGNTTAPPLLTEADLIALMEKHGIGTDATHAEHIHTIKERGYIGEIDKGLLVPGTVGMGLFEGYDAMELPLAYPKLRADFEADLKKICNGEKNAQVVLREQIQHYKLAYRQITEKFRAMCEKMAKRLNTTAPDPPPDDGPSNAPQRVQEVLKCPKCSKFPMALKMKKDNTSYYIGCVGFPECKNSVWLSDELKDVKVLEEECPKCGPGYKKLRVKLKSLNYMALLNAESANYKTCLACDAKFREVFNINAANVKKLGAIVSDRPASNPSNSTASSSSAHTTNSGPSVNSRRQFSDLSSTRPTSNSNSRFSGSYSGNNNDNAKEDDEKTAADVLFADDDFDDVLLTSDWNSLEEAGSTNHSGSAAQISNRNESDSSHGGWGTGGRNDVPSFGWGASSSNNQGWNRANNSTTNRGWGSSSSGSNKGWGSSSKSTNERSNIMVWGSNHEIINLDNSWDTPSNMNIGRQNSNDNSRSTSTEIVKCSSCNLEAKLLTVKKDGPNQGRQFYACSKPQYEKCNFFQWADENQPNSSSSNTLDDASESTNNRGSASRMDNESSLGGWGTGGRNAFRNQENNNRGWGSSSSANNEGWGSSSKRTNDQSKTMVWGSRQEIINLDDSWGTSSNRDNARQNSQNNTPKIGSEVVKCSSCNLEAKLLTVKKDGPNQGRPFYTCSKPPNEKCNFFQWADENQPNSSSSNTLDDASESTNNRGSAWQVSSVMDNDSSFGGWGTGERSAFRNQGNNNRGWGSSSSANNEGWGSSSKRTNDQSKTMVWGTRQEIINLDDSWGTSSNRNNARLNSQNNTPKIGSEVVKCSSCNLEAKLLTVKKDGPNQGRQFYACSKPPNEKCNFFQWADENQSNNSNSNAFNSHDRHSNEVADVLESRTDSVVRCSGCDAPARSLTVRREGPNQGRTFYACPKPSRPCQFFKWGDVEDTNNEPGTNWGSGSNQRGWGSHDDRPSTSWGTGVNRQQPSTSKRPAKSNDSATSSDRQAKKRKCGLCRQEGHTKLKCPRKEEFGDL